MFAHRGVNTGNNASTDADFATLCNQICQIINLSNILKNKAINQPVSQFRLSTTES